MSFPPRSPQVAFKSVIKQCDVSWNMNATGTDDPEYNQSRPDFGATGAKEVIANGVSVGSAPYSGTGSPVESGGGKYRHFNGSQALSGAPTLIADLGTDTSAASWAFWASGAGQNKTVLSKWRATGNQRSWRIDATSLGTMVVRLSEDGTTFRQTSSETVAASKMFDGDWHFVAIVFDGAVNGGKPLFYVNGVVIGYRSDNSTTINSLYGGTAVLALGGKNTGSGETITDEFTGGIDNASIWDRALTSREITYLYNNGNGREFPL